MHGSNPVYRSGLCHVLSCVHLLVMLWTAGCQAPLSMRFSRQNTGVGCHALLQGIFSTQGSNPCLLCLLHFRWVLYPLSHPGRPKEDWRTAWYCMANKWQTSDSNSGSLFLLLKRYAFFPLTGCSSDSKLQEQDLFWYISHVTCRISLQECHWEEANGRLLAILQSHDYVLKDILWKSSGHKL